MTRYFIDTEFLDDGQGVIPISIGIVCEDGREFYAQDGLVKDCDWSNYPWLAEHVIAHLSDDAWQARAMIRLHLKKFINDGEGKPEFWGWCAAHDFVVLCQFFGSMMALPLGFPHYIKDFQQVLDERGISDEELPEQEEGLHNALEDARHLKRLWGYIVRNDCWQ